MKIKSILVIAAMLFSMAAHAYGVRYTRVFKGDGQIRAEIIDQHGYVVATGHSGKEGSRKSRKKAALDDALEDLEENED